jgi:hypothetical protein
MLFGGCPVAEAVEQLASATDEQRGAVFTRREVVDFILDLVGYTADRPLHQYRLLEPSFGNGDFLIPAVTRLLDAYDRTGPTTGNFMTDLQDAIRAVEIHHASVSATRTKLLELLIARGIPKPDASLILESWLIPGDFLLVNIPEHFTHAVGNPPYVRQEMIPQALLAEYRARYRTIYDRADIYIPFIERSLRSLAPGGTLAFICADRWMKNRYGGPLRELISKHFHLRYYVDMVDTPAFHSNVIAYPAITVIAREPAGPTRVSRRPPIERETLSRLAAAMRAPEPPGDGIIELPAVANGSEPWIVGAANELGVIRRLEAMFPTLEDAGCRVGIGVATGADRVFIGPFDSLPVEPDRKLPLATTKDIESGSVVWRGLGVINPFKDDGTLVRLDEYPALAAYLTKHASVITKRNVAKRNSAGWYRTIDRIYPDLAIRPKLLIPDIKGEANVVYEDGKLYPHHNLYYITSEQWDLRALQAVLRSEVAKLFISTYSTRMRGGYLRFQAQYLRRIRIPQWSDVPDTVRSQLVQAAIAGDVAACNEAAFDLYGLTTQEREFLSGQ